jgi:capsular exopolysaccharide synthesis family protein
VHPARDDDQALFRNFSTSEQFFPGNYNFRVDRRTKRWRLTIDDAQIADSGAVGDSIGRVMGLRWSPDVKTLAKVSDRDVKFSLATPRETSQDLMKHFAAVLPLKSNFLYLSFTDRDGKQAAKVLNALSVQYVNTAADLKKGNTSEFAKILGRQVEFSEASLKEAETALENFKVQTITLPSEGVPVAAGIQETTNPAMSAFFARKIEYDNLKHDREALERAIASGQGGEIPLAAVLSIPFVMSPAGEQLRQQYADLNRKQSDLDRYRLQYKDEYQPLRDLITDVQNLRTRTIPATANAVLNEIKEKEADYQSRIGAASSDLQAIPARTIEEMRLKRNVMVSEGLYQQLKARYAEASLSEAQAAPDVSILDSANTPLKPTKNTAPAILGGALLGGFALAIGIALLLDMLDRRIRYPDQVSRDLGLQISGTIPELLKAGVPQTPEQISQLIESFRTLRMNVMHSSGQQVALAVSSPSPGDGKSFIASNLAMSFADAGFRTLLVDGDTRRGALHDMFGLPRTWGLTDFLAGDADERAIVHATGHENLFLVPTGTLRRRSPELLTSPALGQLVTDLRRHYDVLIFDTPPFAAGVDGYAIAAATGNLLVVVRVGQTERRMAAAKLLLVDRLPINVVGSVLNAAPTRGEYEYYGYVSGYATEDMEPGEQVAQIAGG